MSCPHCDSDRPHVFMGILGALAWLRCRSCGAEFSTPAEDVIVDLPDSE